MNQSCPLCDDKNLAFVVKDRYRAFFQCLRCQLIFVPAQFHLSPEAEKAQYDLHQNNPEDLGYRQFLSRLYTPLSARLAKGSTGLDFGSGPGPTLSRMFIESGHDVSIYDPYYAPCKEALTGSYDFVTASEVVEHLASPGKVLLQLWALVRSGGWLGLMTKMVADIETFSVWHYKNDPTHIAFYSRGTFHWLAATWGAHLELIGEDVILMRKSET